MQVGRILVVVKPWQRGLPLSARHARELAQRLAAQIQVVGTVFDASAAARSERGEPAARAARERALAASRVDLERLAGSLRACGANVTTRVVWGVPVYEGIIAVAREWRADLLVVGAHELGTMHTRLTDTDWQLLRRAECPVLLVKNPSFGAYNTVLAAVDPLHAHDERDGLEHDVLAAAEQFGIAAGDLVAPDEIVESLATRRADLVIVGAPRPRGALGAILDSTAESVVTDVACDVLIVPEAIEALRSKVG
jgi:nucleotide-binding universal stress UspA family protein